MKRQISLRLAWPPTVNTYWRWNDALKRMLISSKGRRYRKHVKDELVVQRQPGVRLPLEGGCVAVAVAAPPDKRTRDLDNLLKAPLDSAEKAGLVTNDSQVDILIALRDKMYPKGRFTLTLTELGPEFIEDLADVLHRHGVIR